MIHLNDTFFYMIHLNTYRSQNGKQLIVCSWDGTVAYIGFGDEEIGKPATAEEKVCSFSK